MQLIETKRMTMNNYTVYPTCCIASLLNAKGLTVRSQHSENNSWVKDLAMYCIETTKGARCNLTTLNSRYAHLALRGSSLPLKSDDKSETFAVALVSNFIKNIRVALVFNHRIFANVARL